MKNERRVGVRHYSGADDGAYYHSKRVLGGNTAPWVFRNRARKFQKFVSGSDVVFEFGCGSGWNLASLECAKKMGHDIANVLKPSVEALGIDWIADPADLSEESVDVVISHHSLEHVPSPSDALLAMRRVLKPEGRLLLVVPQEADRRPYSRKDREHHLYSWTRQTIGNLVSDCGFEVEQIDRKLTGYERFATKAAPLGERGYNLFLRGLQIVRPVRELIVQAKPSQTR